MKDKSVNPDCGFNEGGKQEENPLYAGTYYIASARINACKGKKRGNDCEWKADDGSKQKGKCYYSRYGLTRGPLYCTSRDWDEGGDTNAPIDE